MNQYSGSVIALARLPSACIPMAMSLTALAVVLGSIAISGVVHQADEGFTAHVWQLLMVGQLPLLAFFAIKWLPRTPRQALAVVALQIVTTLAAIAPVLILGL
jgi:hypothetical protein